MADAAEALEHATAAGSDLCGPLVAAIGMTGAAVSTLGDPLGSETVCASDARAARLDEIQLDLGEGPCWEAMTTRRPVLEPDVQGSGGTSWPLARHAMHATGLGAVFAFPLVVAGLSLGAVDLYSRTPRDISDREVTDATALTRIVARQVLRRALLASEGPQEDTGAWESRYSRREVHQATGMVVAQMGVSPADALLVLRGHAFATGRSLREVAEDVVGRTLDFTPDR
ncbi:GAF and ANTAR domain-containing protein [Clavibacter michiganensis]|uniref:GAF and ANTAR domain-containing protein n=1 Tax=Clavibacter michiganensis TaxID=28447 RepID=UPI000A763C11|nr:GAF and ANTAR domain-containing protein [Clavibacter michiganensis]